MIPLQDIRPFHPTWGLILSGQFNFTSSFITGLLPRSRVESFERIIWRVLRGNTLLKFSIVEEPIRDWKTEELILKTFFIAIVPGQQFLSKISKIGLSMGATIIDVDKSAEERHVKLSETIMNLDDIRRVITSTQMTRKSELLEIASSLNTWFVFVRKQKSIFHTMNHFSHNSDEKYLIGEGWCPTQSLNAVKYALHAASERSGSSVRPIMNEVSSHMEPPTFHRTNKWTNGFQEIIDAYGVARYREINPGLFTVITFPFLFAIMFGDWGHGIFMFLIALYLCVCEKSLMKMDGGEVCRRGFSY